MASLTLVTATKNPGKVRELAALLADMDVRLLSLADFPELPDIPEEGATFAENARFKAKETARLTGLPALADDSGLEVAALGGRPGVFSARYAQDRTAPRPPTDEDNWRKLLDEMQNVPWGERRVRLRNRSGPARRPRVPGQRRVPRLYRFAAGRGAGFRL